MRRHSAELRTVYGVWHNSRLRLQQSCSRAQLDDFHPPSERCSLPIVPVSRTFGLLRIQHLQFTFLLGRKRRSGAGEMHAHRRSLLMFSFPEMRCQAAVLHGLQDI